MGRKKNADVEKGRPCRKTKIIKVLYSCSRMGIPKISMEGKWLEKAGFLTGNRVQVDYCEDYIRIHLAV